MTGRIPEPPSRMEEEGIPDPAPQTPEQAATGQDEGVMEPPHDTPMAVDDWGTTAEEQHEGEPLDLRLRREVPDVPQPSDQDRGVGRLVEPDEGTRMDTEKDMIGTDVGTDLGGFSAEEAALHVEPEP